MSSRFADRPASSSFCSRHRPNLECIEHLKKKRFVSIVTSLHVKEARNAVLNEVDYTVYPKLAV
jgi:tRNA (guanosine-2'-O-)-methyltransferase